MQLSETKAKNVHPQRNLFRKQVLALGVLLLMASACSTQGVASTSVELLCTVEGVKLLPSGTTEESVCGEIKREIDGALSRQTRTVKSVAGIGSADWIKIAVRFTKPGTASAAIVQRVGQREIVHPEIAVDIMDKPLGAKEVRLLAAEAARAVVKATKSE